MTTNDDVPPTSGWVYLAFAAIAGGLALGTNTGDDFPDWLPLALLGIASLLGAIGATAVGVTAGIQRAEWHRRRRT